jgi:predicted secreted hydrolase
MERRTDQTGGRRLIRVYAFIAALALTLPALSADELALPGYRFRFPRDHFDHPSYQTEWWYYTGNLESAEGRRFGFEVTFFRFHPDDSGISKRNLVWYPSQIYIGHFALSDLTGKHFYHRERLNRAGPGLAGIDTEQKTVWNGNWSARWITFEPARQQLEAVSPEAHLRLDLVSKKSIVIHGQDGLSRKGPKPGEASHYYSLTRIAASGGLSLEGQDYKVSGQAWMDREFFSSVPGDTTAGWDWICIQLNNNQELMLFRLRAKDGSFSPYSSGTFVDENGRTDFLPLTQFSLTATKHWHSPVTGGDYPVEWRIKVPGKQLDLTLTTALPAQELINKATRSYWEGAVDYTGTEAGSAVRGVGYLEMTGYDRRGRHRDLEEAVKR